MLDQFHFSPKSSRHPHAAVAGFTLIELMVTVALAAMLMLVAVPSYVQFQRNAQLSDAVSNFIAAVNAARSNAMKEGYNTYVVPNSASNWSSGWMVFTDSNFDQSASGEKTVLSHDAIDSGITVKTGSGSTLASGYVLFNGSGYPRTKTGGFGGGTLELSNPYRKISIIIDPAGRIRSCKPPGTSTDCPVLP
jgi:type IV fimbrial biogenesis protein FimT